MHLLTTTTSQIQREGRGICRQEPFPAKVLSVNVRGPQGHLERERFSGFKHLLFGILLREIDRILSPLLLQGRTFIEHLV